METVFSDGVLDAQEAPAPIAPLSVPAYAPAPPVPAVHAVRNPFAPALPPPASYEVPPPAFAGAASASALPVLPANAGAAGAPIAGIGPITPAPPASRALEVVGVTTGDVPHALLSDGVTTDVYAIGDRISGHVLKSISLDGVTLSGGIRLHVGPAAL